MLPGFGTSSAKKESNRKKISQISFGPPQMMSQFIPINGTDIDQNDIENSPLQSSIIHLDQIQPSYVQPSVNPIINPSD